MSKGDESHKSLSIVGNKVWYMGLSGIHRDEEFDVCNNYLTLELKSGYFLIFE